MVDYMTTPPLVQLVNWVGVTTVHAQLPEVYTGKLGAHTTKHCTYSSAPVTKESGHPDYVLYYRTLHTHTTS